VSGFIAKVARLAASKAAAFGYAVAVGVAGNIAFHYVETAAPPPATAASVAVRPASADAAPTPMMPATPAPTVAARPNPKPPAPPRPAAPHRTVASAPVLPEPPATVALPPLDALPPPALKPAFLPREAATPPVAPSVPRRAAVPEDASAALTPVPSLPATPAPVTLPPLGPAIEVDAPPTPPSADALPPPAPAAAIAPMKKPPATKPPSTEPPGGIEISDLWHPGRAVRRGLHWAGRQVPLVGDDNEKPTPRRSLAAPHAAVSAPIPLLPAAGEPTASGQADAAPPPRKPVAPGPGSGGLY
jgi:hypothetical protein